MTVGKEYRDQTFDMDQVSYEKVDPVVTDGEPAADPVDEDEAILNPPKEDDNNGGNNSGSNTGNNNTGNNGGSINNAGKNPGTKQTAKAPKKVTKIKVKKLKKALSLRWKSQKNVTYRIAYSTSKKKLSKIKNGKLKAVKGTKVIKVTSAKKTIKKLKKSKKYYLKICAVSKNGKNIGKWSGVISAKTK